AASPAGVKQIYAYENNTGFLKPLTAGVGPSTHATIDQNGSLVGWQSSADLLHDGHDTGVQQIFWSNYDKRNHTSVVHQLTNGNGPSQNPYFPDNSPFAVFDSAATNLPGTLGGGGTQVYMS